MVIVGGTSCHCQLSFSVVYWICVFVPAKFNSQNVEQKEQRFEKWEWKWRRTGFWQRPWLRPWFRWELRWWKGLYLFIITSNSHGNKNSAYFADLFLKFRKWSPQLIRFYAISGNLIFRYKCKFENNVVFRNVLQRGSNWKYYLFYVYPDVVNFVESY